MTICRNGGDGPVRCAPSSRHGNLPGIIKGFSGPQVVQGRAALAHHPAFGCYSITRQIGGALFLWAFLSASVWAQEPVPNLLRRATTYVEDLHTQLSAMVAEERYDQTMSGDSVAAPGGFRRRALRSEFLFFRPEGADRYFGFRDVVQVDRREVRDRDERLVNLFLEAAGSATRQAAEIRRESARYNLGGVDRNFNTPTYALLFLRASHTLRFEFERTEESSLPLGVEELDDDLALVVLQYREVWPTTVLRGRDGRNMPAQGRFWIEPATGHVLATELKVDDEVVSAHIAVRFEHSEEMGHLVPVEMRERYDNRRERFRIEGTATYRRFRRFQVEVSEGPP